MGNKKILVAALNWGLGHATRCIPIINELLAENLEPIIASDGQALKLLEREFPQLTCEELPSYKITYTQKGYFLKWKLLLHTPSILRTIKAEREITEKLAKKYNLSGIISDNRWGVRSDKIKKNVFITHQLNVLSGNTTFLSSHIQKEYIKNFQECWIPDTNEDQNLSGIMGHPKKLPENVKYIGPLSRFQKKELPVKYDYLVLLSGPEPQRSILESILFKEFKKSELKVLFVRGVISEEEFQNPAPNITVKNYLYGISLENAINSSNSIISRSGYTTLMDLCKLEKKAFFIPTPGQPEQEYLARRMEKLGFASYSSQDEFNLEKLEQIEKYTGLGDFGDHSLLRDRLTFFQSE